MESLGFYLRQEKRKRGHFKVADMKGHGHINLTFYTELCTFYIASCEDMCIPMILKHDFGASKI